MQVQVLPGLGRGYVLEIFKFVLSFPKKPTLCQLLSLCIHGFMHFYCPNIGLLIQLIFIAWVYCMTLIMWLCNTSFNEVTMINSVYYTVARSS